jgi:crotonobetainyl-CoA:carnitine CoA-transferase CaiB-like acyl-CoA transferase
MNDDRSKHRSGEDSPAPLPALSGLRVIDLSNTLCGTQTSQIFADNGAEVIHVEPPGGSPLRQRRAWPFWGRGKKSLELDLHDASDIEVAQNLAATADVVIETLRPGKVEHLGLDYETLSRDHPRLVYGSITGFGRNGPYAQSKGYEGILLARMGALWSVADMTARPGPSFPSAPYCSFPASQLLAQGLFAALFERERSGMGQRVETSLLKGLSVHDTFNWFARVIATRYPGSFDQKPFAEDGIPCSDLAFRLLIALTADGHWLQFSQTVERLFRAMMSALELDWMFSDPRFETAPQFEDLDRRVEFWEHLLAAVRKRTADEWLEIFDEHPDVWGERFRTEREVLEHPQMLWNRAVIEIDDPDLGPVKQPGALVQVGTNAPPLTRPAARIGQHNEALREEARLAAETIATGTPPKEKSNAPTGRAPLEGVTCLELGTYYAAPFGATLLAELGARVIKIEQLDGDPMRNMLPFPEIAGIKALQGKESLAVDIGTVKGHEIVLDLARGADIVLQSFRAGVADRLGVDAASLRAVNPDLIYVSSPGYGVGGPCGHRPAYAPTIGAGAGLAWRNAGATIPARDDLTVEETKSAALQLVHAVMGVGNSDGYSAVAVGTALTLGLLARARGAAAGDYLTTMLTTTSHALSDAMVEYTDAPDPPTADPELHGFNALYRLYETSDDWIFLAAPTERDWSALTRALRAHIDLARDERFASAAVRTRNDAQLIDLLTPLFRSRPASDWERELGDADVACTATARPPVESHFMDPGSVGDVSGLIASATHPTLDEHPRLESLIEMSRSVSIVAGGCLVGDHTDRILRDIGYDDDRLATLRSDGVVGGIMPTEP